MQHTIYSICLVIHIIGITMMAGATLIDYTTFRQFWMVWPADKTKALTLENMLHRFQRFMGIGMGLILLGGIGMMAYLHQVWGQQTWFQIKMILLLLVIVNGLAIRRRLGNSFKKLLQSAITGDVQDAKLVAVKKNMSTIQFIQLFLFLVIFVLSVFKFN